MSGCGLMRRAELHCFVGRVGVTLHHFHRETKEKLNIWAGWMNLENLYGSEETLLKVFEAALRENEPIEVYKHLATIYAQSQKVELAGKLYQTMTRKFSGVQWVWSQYATFLMRHGKQTQARALLQRALKSLVSKQDRESRGKGRV